MSCLYTIYLTEREHKDYNMHHVFSLVALLAFVAFSAFIRSKGAWEHGATLVQVTHQTEPMSCNTDEQASNAKEEN